MSPRFDRPLPLAKAGLKAEEARKSGDVALLRRMLESPVREERREAATELGRCDPSEEITETLVAALRDEHWLVRREAVIALGRGEQTPEVTSALKTCLKDPERDVRLYGMLSLGKLRALDAIDCLERQLESRDALAREHAAEALGLMAHRKALPGLLRSAGDERRSVFSQAMLWLQGLVQPGDEEALIALARTVPWARRRNVRRLLRRIGDTNDRG